MPEIGENVHVWPHPGRNVRSHAELNRMLPREGMALPWSGWLEELFGQGMVHLTDPAAQVTVAEARKLIEAAVEPAKPAPEAPAAPPVDPPAAAPAPIPTSSPEGK